MNMNCGWIQTGLAALILVFVIWPTQILSATYSKWVVIIAAVLLLIHAVTCKKCCGVMCSMNKEGDASKPVVDEKPVVDAKPVVKKKK